MHTLTDALAGETVVVDLPRGLGLAELDPGEWMPQAEVMVQEGIRALTVPVAALDDLAPLAAAYGRRLRLGVSGVTSPGAASLAADAGARFILASVHDPALRDAARGVPVVMGALTPGEVARCVAAGERAVVVHPADALGSGYARTLPPLFPDVDLVAMGRLERYQCDQWFEAGARAVVTQDVVLRTPESGGSNEVDEVARRAGAFATPVQVNRS